MPVPTGVILALILIALTAVRMFRQKKEADYTTVDENNVNVKKPPIRPPRVNGKVIAPILIVVILLALIGGSVYQLQEDQYAVITTFGVPGVVNTSGLKFKIPVIQKKTIVSKNVQGFPIGYRMDTNERNQAARALYARLGYSEPSIVDCVFNGIPGVRLVCLEKTLTD